MTVIVTRRDGVADKYMRFGDAYSERNDGTLDVFRSGASAPYTYVAGEWSHVEGDQKRGKRSRFWTR